MSSVDDDLILVRTETGQHAAFDDGDLDAQCGRLLRLVNGHTSLGNLVARLDPRHDWRAAAVDLLRQQLVAANGVASSG